MPVPAWICTGPSHLRSRWDSQCPRGRDSPSLQAFGRPSVRWKMAPREGEVKSNGGWLFEGDGRLGWSRQWAYVVHGALSDSPHRGFPAPAIAGARTVVTPARTPRASRFATLV